MEFDNLARSLLDINAIAKRAKAQGLNFDAASFSTMTFVQKLQYLQHITGALSSNINDETYSMMKNADASKLTLQQIAYLDLHLDKANSSFMKLTGGAAAFIPAAILLSGKASEYNHILDEMHDKTDVVVNAFKNMRDTANQQWKMMQIGVQNVLIVLGLQLLPVLQNIYHGIYLVANAFLDWVENTANMEAFKYALLGIAIVVATILTPAIVGLALAFVTNPIFLSIMAIVGAGILLGKVLQAHPEIIKKVQQAFGALMDTVGKVIGVFHTLADMISGHTRSAQLAAEEHATQMRLHVVDQTLLMQRQSLAHLETMRAQTVDAMAHASTDAERQAQAQRYRYIQQMIIMRERSIAEAEKMRTGIEAHLKSLAHAHRTAFGPILFLLGTLGSAIGNAIKQLAPVVQFIGSLLATAGKMIRQAFADPAIHRAFADLQRSFVQFAPVLRLVGALLGAVGAIILGVIVVAIVVAAAAIRGLAAALPGLLRGFGGILSFIGGIARIIIDLLTGNFKDIPKAFEQIGHAVMAILGGFGSAVFNFFGHFVTVIIGFFMSLFDELVGHSIIPDMVKAIITWIMKLVALPYMLLAQVITPMINVMKTLATVAIQIAKDFLMGLVHGIENGAIWVINAIKSLAGGMIDKFKQMFNIHSPSGVMFAHGVNIVQGLINGFRSINVGQVWMQHVAGLTQPISASFAAAGEGRIPGGGYGGGFRIPQGGGTVTHNWTLNFPNAKHASEIKQAILEAQQETYRRSRRAGSYGGFGSDYTTDS